MNQAWAMFWTGAVFALTASIYGTINVENNGRYGYSKWHYRVASGLVVFASLAFISAAWIGVGV